MLRSRLFWKLLLTFVGLTMVATVALALLTYNWERQLLEQRAHAELQQAARFLEADLTAALSADGADGVAGRVERVAETAALQSRLRVTVMTAEGKVVAETAHPDHAIEKFSPENNRPEMIAALAHGESSIQRQSMTLDVPLMYYALRLGPADKPLGVVRVAMPRELIEQRLQVFRQVLAGVTLAIIAAASLVTYAVVRHLVKPVLTLNAAAQSIAKGDYEQRIFVPGNDELAALARSFNQLSHDLGTQLTELRASDQRQATVLGGMVEGVVAVDSRQRVLFANAAAGRIFGFLPPAAQGRPLLEVIRHHELHAQMQQAIKQKRPRSLDMYWEGTDNRVLNVQLTPLPGDPCPGVVIVMHDTTELRRLEKIRREFVANVSHELKTPLSSIKAYCETLLNGAIDDHENRIRFLERIAEQSDRLHDLIQDMLHLARVETPQQPFELVPVSVDDVARRCVENHQARAQAKQIRLSIETETPAKVVAEEEGLRVILDNLVDNAVKYTPEQGIVRVAWQREGADRVKLSVIDNGIGIPRADLPRVFERFYRVDKARSRELGSTGLGLSIVKHLAQSFGGTAGVDSTVGKGAHFWVSLPAA